MMIFLTLLIGLAQAEPFKIGVVAEPQAMVRAKEFIQHLNELEPFKQLREQNALTISESPVLASSLSCSGGAHGITRLAQCDLGKARKLCQGMDFCPLFTEVANIGSGGAFNPISSATFPWTTMLHEMVHSFGFTDDYAYTRSEAGKYCGVTNWANGHRDAWANNYSTEDAALKGCLRRVPWCKDALAAGTVVVQKKSNGKFAIGSPPPSEGCPSLKLGVYLGGACQNQNPNSTWRPYFCPTVMGYPALGEDHCGVTGRHAIILASPNLIPPYYQQQIFNKIVSRKNIKNLTFKPSPAEAVAPDFRYGIPEVDALRFPTEAQTSNCKANPHADVRESH